jgi:hypothetical protein
MDKVLNLFFIILGLILVIKVIGIARRTVTILLQMQKFKKFPGRMQIKPLPPGEIPEAVNEAVDKISEIFKNDNLVKVGDFQAEGSPGYLSLFRNDNEKIIVRMGSNLANGYIGIQLDIFTYFIDGTMVCTTNALVPPLASSILPHETLRHFLDCMPADLVRLHKEYLTHRTPQLERLEISKDIVKFIQEKEQEENQIKIKLGQIKRDKDDGFFKYSFFYAFAMTSNILKHHEYRAKKHPCTITDIPYEKGFDYWLNPDFPGAYEHPVPGDEKNII